MSMRAEWRKELRGIRRQILAVQKRSGRDLAERLKLAKLIVKEREALEGALGSEIRSLNKRAAILEGRLAS